MEGRIIKNISNDYVVMIGDKTYTCKPRGKFRKDNIIPLVGDIVDIDVNNNYILDIKKRKNSLIRPSVANIDKAIIVTSVYPKLDTNLLDKLLVLVSYNNIEPIICFTKLDKITSLENKEIDNIIDYYKRIGYKVVKNTELDLIKDILKNSLSVFVGQSGAGKSTLLNTLDNSLELKTNEISLALGRGKHTTRHVELFLLYDGLVVDTPGFSSLDLSELSDMDIRDNMNEMFNNLDFCKYRDCMHVKEDGCYVKELVNSNDILESRYNNYLSFLRK